jgi:hypothetical protein
MRFPVGAEEVYLQVTTGLSGASIVDTKHQTLYFWGMDMIPINGALCAFLELERQDLEEAAASIRRGYEDVRAGRTRPAAEFLADLRLRYGFPC